MLKIIEDPYIAGELADGLGHPVRVMIVRILREKREMSIKDIQKEIRKKYERDVPYPTLVAHVRKLIFSGICKEKKVNNLNGIELVKDVEVILWEK